MSSDGRATWPDYPLPGGDSAAVPAAGVGRLPRALCALSATPSACGRGHLCWYRNTLCSTGHRRLIANKAFAVAGEVPQLADRLGVGRTSLHSISWAISISAITALVAQFTASRATWSSKNRVCPRVPRPRYVPDLKSRDRPAPSAAPGSIARTATETPTRLRPLVAAPPTGGHRPHPNPGGRQSATPRCSRPGTRERRAAEVLGQPATRDTLMKNSPKLIGPC